MGGRDTPTISSLANTLANSAGIAVPFAGVWLRTRFGGSWLPHLLSAAALKVCRYDTEQSGCRTQPLSKLLVHCSQS